MKSFTDVIKSRKSIRSFQDKTVSRDLIRKIIEAGTHAPTNCNQQLWNFIVVDDFKTKEKLITEAASNTLFRRAPVLIVVTYDGWNYKEAIQGAALAVGHMLLAATDLGVGSLPMNSYGADSQVKRILNIPKREEICCFVILGYPDEKADKSPKVERRIVEEVIHWGRFKDNNHPPFTYDPEDWDIEQIKAHQRYYCRKTFLGKEMDILSEKERELVSLSMSGASAPLVDFLTYDGAYISQLPKIESTYVDLIKETSLYSREAARLSLDDISHINFKTYDQFENGSLNSVSLIYKLERIPDSFKKDLFKKSFNVLNNGGELTIISRKSNFFLGLFYLTIKLFFGKELRKTGIYNFFGPYKPISLDKTINQLKEAGFNDINYNGYFIFPAFYEQAFQMYLQYKKSEGSSYLHREKRTNFVTRILSVIIKIQGLRRFGRLGSVVVIKCRK